MAKRIKQHDVVTRKDHQCQACGEVIPAGTKTEKTVNTEDGRISSHYWCWICRAYMSHMDPIDLEQGFNFDIWDDGEYAAFRDAVVGNVTSATGPEEMRI